MPAEKKPIIPAMEDKLERVLKVGLDHISATAALKADLAAAEKDMAEKIDHMNSDLVDVLSGFKSDFSAFKDSLTADVKAMVDAARTEILGDLGGISTDAVDDAEKAVADLASASSVKPAAPSLPEDDKTPAVEDAVPSVVADNGRAGPDVVITDKLAAPAAPAAPAPTEIDPVVTHDGTGFISVGKASGETVHTADDGTVTTVKHSDGSASAVNADGKEVDPHPTVLNSMTDAITAAGVEVPTPVPAA